MEAFVIKPLAIVTVTEAEWSLAVVRGWIAEEVKEASIDVVAVEGFGKDLDRLLAIPAAVDASQVKPVIESGLSIRHFEEPIGMSVEDIFVGLAEIPAAHDPDLAPMGLGQYLAKSVLSFRQVRAHIVVLNFAGIQGSDATCRHHEHVGVEIFDVGNKGSRVKRSVSFAKVGLQPPDGLRHPPAWWTVRCPRVGKKAAPWKRGGHRCGCTRL
jgi:hypothetical protein